VKLNELVKAAARDSWETENKYRGSRFKWSEQNDDNRAVWERSARAVILFTRKHDKAASKK
jgi:hypothetical protein